MSKHEVDENCEVCHQEESKSPSLKISGTKILERVILPSNECWICDLKFEDPDSQVNHFIKHHECEFCIECLDSLEEKGNHVLIEHECPICGKYFGQQYQRNYHILEDYSLHACDYCEKCFPTESEVVDHGCIDHFICRFCILKDFDSLQETIEHVFDKHAECPNCGKWFRFHFQRDDHIKKEHQ